MQNAVQSYLQRIAKSINIPSGIKFIIIFSFPVYHNLHLILIIVECKLLDISFFYATNINKHK